MYVYVYNILKDILLVFLKKLSEIIWFGRIKLTDGEIVYMI